MPDHFDRLENRTPVAREAALLRDLRHVLTVSKPRVPFLRHQLRGIDIAKIQSRADLAAIPLIRRTDLIAAQGELPPFGGMNAVRTGALRHIFLAGPMAMLCGQARDWWGAGRALYAAGLRKGVAVLNCFPYDLAPLGHMAESGAAAVGCPVIPAGAAPIDQKIDAVARLRPGFYCGRSEELKAILDRAVDLNVDVSCLKNALVTGPTSRGLRNEYSLRGVNVRHAFVTNELGVVAYESGATEGMTVNEGLILEIVDPATGLPLPNGVAGEIIVTRINVDCPILRYATGAISSVSAQPSTCGRSNMRIRAPHDRKPDFVDMDGRRIHISDIVEIARRYPSLGRMSLVMRRPRDNDELCLRVEHGGNEQHLRDNLAQTFELLTRLNGKVEFVPPGSLSDDDAMIVDERPLN